MRRLVVWVSAAAWLAVVACGFTTLWRYEATPGRQGPAPVRWPVESRLGRDRARPTLVLVLHPRCPCSQTTVAELEEIMARCQSRLRTHVLFFKPAGSADDWAHGALWDRVAAISGVEHQCDEEGAEGRRFGAATSGHAVLYDAQGELRFSGGITPGRGHGGDNEGRRAILARVLGESRDEKANTRVYGCPLCQKESAAAEGW